MPLWVLTLYIAVLRAKPLRLGLYVVIVPSLYLTMILGLYVATVLSRYLTMILGLYVATVLSRYLTMVPAPGLYVAIVLSLYVVITLRLRMGIVQPVRAKCLPVGKLILFLQVFNRSVIVACVSASRLPLRRCSRISLRLGILTLHVSTVPRVKRLG